MPENDNTMQKKEVITSFMLPSDNITKNVNYLKIRDRSSYAFALVSVATALELNGNTIKNARLAMGGVAHKPWRLTEAERFLVGKTPSNENFSKAAELGMKGAKSYGHNDFKIKLGAAAIREALNKALTV